MKNPKRIFSIIIVLAVLGYGAFVYWDRFWTGPSIMRNYSNLFKKGTDNGGGGNSTSSGASNTGSGTNGENSSEASSDQNEKYLQDCDINCNSFKDQQDQYRACLSACGLPEPASDSNLPCDQRTGDSKDQCYKKKAIDEKNDSICGSISSAAVKKACVDAVAEQVLEGP